MDHSSKKLLLNEDSSLDMEAQAQAILAKDPITPSPEENVPSAKLDEKHKEFADLDKDQAAEGKLQVCYHMVSRCGYKADVGCKRKFNKAQQAKDLKKEMPPICVNCKGKYFAALKAANCCLITVAVLSILIFSGLLLTAAIVMSDETE